MISESLGQWIRLLRSGWSVGSRSTSRNFSPADSCTSSTRASSNQSNQIPPQPPAHTSTVTPSAVMVVMVLEHTGHSMMRTSLAFGSRLVSVSLAISVLSGPSFPVHLLHCRRSLRIQLRSARPFSEAARPRQQDGAAKRRTWHHACGGHLHPAQRERRENDRHGPAARGRDPSKRVSGSFGARRRGRPLDRELGSQPYARPPG